MSRDKVVWSHSRVAEPCWIVRADADGETQIVVGYCRVLEEVVHVAEVLARERAGLNADVLLLNDRDQVRVLRVTSAVPGKD